MTNLKIVRRINARPSIVFDILSSPEGLTSWWGPDDLPVLFAEADVSIGGQYRVRFRLKDGTEHECAGEFLDIVPVQRILMTWNWTFGGDPQERGSVSRVELRLRAIDMGTELTLVHTNLRTKVSAANHERGWNGALDKLSARQGWPVETGAEALNSGRVLSQRGE